MEQFALKEMTGKLPLGTIVLLVLAAIVLLLAPGIGRAASGCDGAGNCYVLASATGSGTGADWANAYTNLPSTLTRGVTYYVGVGTYPGHLFADPDSGTAVITIQAPTASNHGTSTGWSNSYVGQAVFNTADSSGVGDIFTFQTDYYVINGVYRSTATGLPETDWVLESGYGFKIDNSSQVACSADIDVADNSATQAMKVHDITIEYVDVNGSHNVTSGGCSDNGFMSDYGGYNETIEYNYIHDNGGGTLYMRGGGYSCSAVGPPPTCSSTPASGRGTGNNDVFEYNYFARDFSTPSAHAEGCSCSEGLQNFVIAYNYWQDIDGTAIIAPATAADWNTGNGGNGPWYIYGNVVFESSCAAVTNGDKNAGLGGFVDVFDSAFTGNLYILNNTLYNIPSSCNSAIDIEIGGTWDQPMEAVYVQNNLWSNIGSGLISPANSCPSSNGHGTCTSMTWGYNAYFAAPDGSNDTDSNKQVSSNSAPFTNASAYNFLLTSDTTAGYNTSSEVSGNSTDLFGTARGADGVWDRGALQIAGQPPNPPTNLTATAH